MIAYEVLVQTIADWKAGVRPTAPTPPVGPAMPQPVEELSSGVVDLEEEEVGFASEGDEEASPYEEAPYEEAQYEEAQYEEAQYEEAQYEEAPYEEAQYDDEDSQRYEQE